MAITFDKTLNVIGVTETSITIQELINAIRDWEDNDEGITVKSIANAYGKQSLTATTAVGITLELINNWRIQFSAKEQWTNCYIEGGNLVAINDYNNDPIKPNTNVNTIIAQSSSPTIVYASDYTWTAQEKNNLISDVSIVKDDTGTIKSDVSIVKDDVGIVKGDTGTIKGDVSTVKGDVSDIKLVWTTENRDDLINNLQYVKKINNGRWKIANNQMVIYDEDNVTPLITFNLYNKYGALTMANPYERKPA